MRFRLNFDPVLGAGSLALANGTMTFYASGTEDIVTIWQDQNLNLPRTNPVPLDSGGRHADIFLDDHTAYRVVVKDALGAIVPGGDVDPVSALVGGGGGGGDGNFTIPDGSITTAKLANGAVTTVKLADGAVTGAKIAPGTISVTRLTVGNTGGALNTDPQPSDMAAWDTSDPPRTNIINIANTGAAGPLALHVFGPDVWVTNGSPAIGGLIPVALDKTYRFHAWYANFPGDGNGANWLGVRFYDGTGAFISDYWAVSGAAPTAGYKLIEAQFGAGVVGWTWPTNAKSMVPIIVANKLSTVVRDFYAQDIRIEEAVGTTLIEDNSITTGKIQADAIKAGQIDAGAVNASDIIVGNIIVTGHLVDNAATIFTYVTHADFPNIPQDGQYHDAAALAFTSEGRPVITSASVMLRNDFPTTIFVYLRLVRNGANGNDRVWPVGPETDGVFKLEQSASVSVSISIAEAPGAGFCSYSWQFKDAGSPNVKILSPFLQSAEIKK